MDSTEIAVLVAVFAAAGYSIYRKYMKRNQEKTYGSGDQKKGSIYHSHPKDDDYEPYSGK